MSRATASLAGLRVVDVGGSLAGAYCARMFAVQGAHVTLVGDDDLDDAQRIYLRAGVSRASGIEAEHALGEADVVIESSATTRVAPRVSGEGAVRVVITPFASSGPYAQWRSSDRVDYALSGHAHLYGDPQRAPLSGPPGQPAIAAGLYGFIGAMAALFQRHRGGGAPLVEVNHHQVMVSLHQMTLLRWSMVGDVLTRLGNRYTGQGQPNGPYSCADGWIAITCVTDPQVEGLLAVSGLLHLLDHPDIDSPMDFQARPELMEPPLRAWLAEQQVDEVVELLQAMRIPACPLRTPLELLDDPQLAARDYFVEHPGDTTLRVPDAPFTISDPQAPKGSGWNPREPAQRPLAGLRVLDLARVWAGPLCTRILADLGAEVIWVEAPGARGPRQLPQSFIDAAGYFPDNDGGERPWNRNGHFAKYAIGKKSLALDLQRDEGQRTFARIVPGAHLLVENFSSRVMPQLGFDEARLHELNPDLVYLTMPGYGRSGPAEHWLAYGSCIDSHAGLSALTGYADAHPWKGGVAWPDPVAGLHACSAALGALWGVAHGAGGCTIEAAQFESTIAAIGDHIVRAQSGQPFEPGSPSPDDAIDDTFRCRGDDLWLAVTATDDSALAALRDLLGVDDSASVDDISVALTALALDSDAFALMHRLQEHGVAAAVATHAPHVVLDPQLDAAANWWTVEQPDIGPFTVSRTPIDFDGDGPSATGPAPTLGEHHLAILAAHGFSADEIADLFDRGVVVDAPPG